MVLNFCFIINLNFFDWLPTDCERCAAGRIPELYLDELRDERSESQNEETVKCFRNGQGGKEFVFQKT